MKMKTKLVSQAAERNAMRCKIASGDVPQLLRAEKLLQICLRNLPRDKNLWVLNLKTSRNIHTLNDA